MALHVTIPGIGPVTLDSAKELLELKTLMEKRGGAEEKKVQRPAEPDIFTPLTGSFPDIREASTMLDAIRRAQPFALQAENLAAAFNIPKEKAKGLGVVIARINKVLSNAGFGEDEVFTSRRTMAGREYRAGPRFDEAVAKIEKQKK